MTQLDGTGDAEASFGALVRNLRQDRQWTLDDLRQRLRDGHGVDLSKTAMARLEQGKRPIRLNEVVALARLLSIDLAKVDPDLRDQTFTKRARENAAHEVRLATINLGEMEQQRAAAEIALEAARTRYSAARRLLDSLEGRLEALRADDAAHADG